MNRLQSRLMLSFFIVIGITLLIIGGALMVFLRSRPVPIDSLVNELGATSLETDFSQVLRNLNATGRDGERERLAALTEYLDTIAETTEYRLLVVTGNNRVLYDSTKQYQASDVLVIQSEQSVIPQGNPAYPRQPLFSSGMFMVSEREWVFVRRRIASNENRQSQLLDVGYIVAAPRPNQTLGLVLENFGDNFLIPLVQAGFVGLLIAGVLSIWVSRSVARPLQRIAEGAGRVAQGDYNHRIPIKGVQEAKVVAVAFNDMTEQVQKTQQAQQDFLANVTHDLRTPLTSIQGFSQALLDGTATEPEAIQRAATVINDEAGRLTRLVSELLDLARIQSGRLQMMRQAVVIQKVLESVGESMQIKAQDEQVQLHVNIDNLPRIAGDGDRLAQVFTNLVDNALKHTSAQGNVWLLAKQERGGVLVQIQDTGEGIPTEDLPRIFERFYQVDKSRNRQARHNSTGLGLAITQEIVAAHHGKIWVESEEGIGTRFNVWLPVLSSQRSTMITQKVTLESEPQTP